MSAEGGEIRFVADKSTGLGLNQMLWPGREEILGVFIWIVSGRWEGDKAREICYGGKNVGDVFGAEIDETLFGLLLFVEHGLVYYFAPEVCDA